MRSTLLRGRIVGVAIVLLSLSALFWAGCSNDNPTNSDSIGVDSETTADTSPYSPRIRSVFEVQNRHTADLLASDNVVGTATGLDENGEPIILIYTIEAASKGALPSELDGIRVRHEVTGRFVAMKGKPGGGGVDPKAKQTPPVQMGTSGGWRHDLANGYCCAGTLGSLVQIGNSKYVLSNYHVLEADIVNGGNGRTASNGDPIIQPGLIDVNCSASAAQDVATLSLKHSLPGSNVDCAVGQVIPGMVDETGAILSIGTISSSTVAAFIGQDVKKMGRTSGLGRSSVSGLNANVNIAYENECAGGSAFTKLFTGQIVIANRGSKFLAGGDSGSLMVEDVSSNPRAVGLLYAGSSTSAIANPIDDVLDFLNATMVGN